MNNILKRLAGQTAIYGLSSMLGRFLNYLLVPLFTRVFAPEQYGIVAEFYAYVTLLLVLLTYGMETGFFRFSQSKEQFNKTYSTVLTSLFFTSLLFALAVNIFAKPIAALINFADHPEWVRYFGFILAFDAFTSIPFAKLRQQGKAWRFAAVKSLNIVANISFNLFFLLLCPYIAENNPDSIILTIYNPNIGIGYIFISNLIASSVTFIILIPDILDVKYNFDIKLLKKMLWYSLPLLIGGFAGMINETLDRILLKVLLPLGKEAIQAQQGIYGANYKLSILMILFIQMFRYAAEPFFFSEGKKKASKKLFAEVTNYFIIFGLLIFLVITGYIDIFKIFIGKEYHEGLHIVPILLIANLFLGIYFNLSVWYKLNDKTRFGAYLAILGAIITIVLNILLIPGIGYLGSAISTLACYTIMMITSYFIGKKHYKIPYDVKSAGIYALISALIFVVFTQVKDTDNIIKFTVNTALILGFVIFAVKKENLISIIKRKKTNES